MDPSLDARGSERSLEVALADPAEGSDDVAYYFHDGALVERRRHGCGEAARDRELSTGRGDAAERPRARIDDTSLLRALESTACMPNVATVMSRAREQALSACRGSPERVLRDLRVPEQPQQSQSRRSGC